MVKIIKFKIIIAFVNEGVCVPFWSIRRAKRGTGKNIVRS